MNGWEPKPKPKQIQVMPISISINAGQDETSSSVTASGSVQHIITDSERTAFNIEDAALKAAVVKYLAPVLPAPFAGFNPFGRAPDDAFLCSPTPWNDLYATYGWPQVQTLLVVQSATILGITSNPEIIATKNFKNTSNVPGTYHCDITQDVSFTHESNWSNTSAVEISQTISYEISFLGSGGGGESSFSYTETWEKGGSDSESITLGTSTGVDAELQPGQAVDAELTASRGELTVQIVYQLSLIGDVAVNFSNPWNGHHFWAYDLKSVMAAAGYPTTITSTQEITVGFYSSSSVVLKNPAGQAMMALPASAKPGVRARLDGP
jgi:hypothetical protein